MRNKELKEKLTRMIDLAGQTKAIGDELADKVAKYGDDGLFDILNQIQDCELTDVEEAYRLFVNSTDLSELAELKGSVVDIFEDFCDEKGIMIANEDRDAEDDENAAIIYGFDYDNITEPVENLIYARKDGDTAETTVVALKTVAAFKEVIDARGSSPLENGDVTVLFKKVVELFVAWGLLEEGVGGAV